MIQKTLKLVVLALAVSLGVFCVLTQAQTPKPKAGRQVATAVAVPAEFQPGIAAMLSAKSTLEKAGDKWGGYRVKAIHSIDQALDACGKQQTKGQGEMKSGSTDIEADIQSAMTQLTTAKTTFEKSGNDWDGRRTKVVSLIDQALKDLQSAIDYAKNRKAKK